MLIIDNREEIQQLILNKTGSPEATEGILTLLEKQENLSQIYDEYINVSKDIFFVYFHHKLLKKFIQNKSL